MLALSHVAAGAALGALIPDARAAAAAAVGAHVLLDSIGHDDATVGVAGQGLLAAAGLATVALPWGARSAVVAGAVAGLAPDLEVAVMKALGREPEDHPLLFPSHWQVPGRRGEHPVRLPGPSVHVGAEVAVAALVCVAVAVAGRRSGSPRIRGGRGRNPSGDRSGSGRRGHANRSAKMSARARRQDVPGCPGCGVES